MASSHAAKTPRLEAPPPPPQHETRLRQCGCTGHCCQRGHKYYRGCSALVMTPTVGGGRRLCDDCTCIVRGCTRPKFDCPLCHKHKQTLRTLPEAMQVVWKVREVAQQLSECDVAAASEALANPRISHDRVLQTMVFWAKEPTAVLQLSKLAQELPTAYTADDMLKVVLRPLAQFMDGRVVPTEHENLNNQGTFQCRNAPSTRHRVVAGSVGGGSPPLSGSVREATPAGHARVIVGMGPLPVCT